MAIIAGPDWAPCAVTGCTALILREWARSPRPICKYHRTQLTERKVK